MHHLDVSHDRGRRASAGVGLLQHERRGNRLVSKTRGPQYPGIVEDYRATFARLKTMKADIVLAPHGEQFGLAAKLAKLPANGPNPFVDPGELARTVAQSEADFTRELAKQEAAAR